MSDSRLEKFIYAICSMDVSDLPVPLSRIEKLWNCLITGETPDLEPLSRNEKYLMAMLDRYDISNLPAPMSRGEKLLYKIAVGETDLSDVPGYLSRYEELLKYLIENSGISEDDFEYVLHTLNQSLYTLYTTAEKPVKSAILKGQTLVNQSTTSELTFKSVWQGQNIEGNTLQSGKKYFVSFNLESDNSELTLQTRNGNSFVYHIQKGFTKGKNILSFILEQDVNGLKFQVGNDFNVNISNIVILEYQDGMENWDIPYFTGMQSVKMPVLKTTGKNLIGNIEWEIDKRLLSDGSIGDFDGNNTSGYINVSNLDMVTFSGFKKGSHCLYDKDKITIGERANTSAMTVDVSGAEYIRVTIRNTEDYSQSQMEKGSVATTYEPYKSNILTVNEDVELRGVGEVKDELDLVTGEVTQRIGEVVFDGSEDWTRSAHDANSPMFYTSFNNLVHKGDYLNSVICDKLMVYANHEDLYYFSTSPNGISAYNDLYDAYPNENWLYIKYTDSEGSVEKFKQWLSQNPITVQYELATESIKTVDLTVVDQDNQPTELGTFENTTHVSLEAENLIPEVEMEVATHISEELASASPLMDDISTKQEQLNTTVDEQSNNVDATMIATTEIFEETL